jgi:hypothetical protein
MVATSKPSPARPTWHDPFLAFMPTIIRQASHAFRGLSAEAREDAVQEVIANCLVAIARLAELNKLDLAYPSALARYAIAQQRAGRRVGTKLNVRDVLSPYCQRAKGISVERLDTFDAAQGAWQEIVVEDKTAGPADIAATRLDFAAWLKSLKPRMRRIAKALAVGETTGAVAGKFRLSPGRVSQLRRELRTGWETFQGEGVAA